MGNHLCCCTLSPTSKSTQAEQYEDDHPLLLPDTVRRFRADSHQSSSSLTPGTSVEFDSFHTPSKSPQAHANDRAIPVINTPNSPPPQPIPTPKPSTINQFLTAANPLVHKWRLRSASLRSMPAQGEPETSTRKKSKLHELASSDPDTHMFLFVEDGEEENQAELIAQDRMEHLERISKMRADVEQMIKSGTVQFEGGKAEWELLREEQEAAREEEEELELRRMRAQQLAKQMGLLELPRDIAGEGKLSLDFRYYGRRPASINQIELEEREERSVRRQPSHEDVFVLDTIKMDHEELQSSSQWAEE